MSEIQILIRFTVWVSDSWHRLLREALYFGRYSKALWTPSWTTGYRWLCFSRPVGLDHFHRSLPFCHSLKLLILPDADKDLLSGFHTNFSSLRSRFSSLLSSWLCWTLYQYLVFVEGGITVEINTVFIKLLAFRSLITHLLHQCLSRNSNLSNIADALFVRNLAFRWFTFHQKNSPKALLLNSSKYVTYCGFFPCL